MADLDELDELLAQLDPTIPFPPEAARMVRGHAGGPRKVKLPTGYLDSREIDRLDPEAELVVSGG